MFDRSSAVGSPSSTSRSDHRVDVGRRPGRTAGIHQRYPAAIEDGKNMAFTTVKDVTHQLAVLERTLGQLRLDALAQHRDDTADHFQMTELLGCDVEQHVLPLRIIFRYSLRKVTHSRGTPLAGRRTATA